MGVSGGEEGARYGPSLMPGGSTAAWPHVKDIFTSIAATAEGEPCCEWVGAGGAGHYVKMVHNGIEYGDMQVIAEAYDIMSRGLGFDAPRDAADLRPVEHGSARLVPHRDHGGHHGHPRHRRRAAPR